jgi:hypothetical protein
MDRIDRLKWCLISIISLFMLPSCCMSAPLWAMAPAPMASSSEPQQGRDRASTGAVNASARQGDDNSCN